MATMVNDAQRTIGQVTALALLDDEFRKRLEANPLDVLREHGMDVSGSTNIEVVRDAAALTSESGDTVQLFIPDAVALSEEELSMVAGAAASCQTTLSTQCTVFTLSTVSTTSTLSCS